MKHTPGKWTIETPAKGQDGFPNNWNVNYNGTHKATYVASIPGAVHIEEAQANAYLIACAPELLEALEGLMRQAVKEIEKNGLADNNPLWAYIDDASDVITRAKGK